LFINAPADAKPASILQDKFNAGIPGTGIVADQGKTSISVRARPMRPSRAPVTVKSSLPPVKLAFLQPPLSAELPDR